MVQVRVAAVLLAVAAVQVTGACVSDAGCASAGRARPWCRSQDLLVLVAGATVQLSGATVQVRAPVVQLSVSVVQLGDPVLQLSGAAVRRAARLRYEPLNES